MALGSPSASTAAKLVYWSGVDHANSTSNGFPSTDSDRATEHERRDRDHDGRSMYVAVFEDMLKEVISAEAKLFTEQELQCFLAWHRLPYSAKYLFCRLCLRKGETWYKVSDLKYESELGAEGILNAMNILCGRVPAEPEDIKPKVNPHDRCIPDVLLSKLPEPANLKPKVEPTESTIPPPLDVFPSSSKDSHGTPIGEEHRDGPELIDLTMDEEDAQSEPRLSPELEPPPPPSSSTPSSTPRAPDYTVFADDEEQAELFDLLDCMTMPELEAIVKQLKLKPKAKKRDVYIDTILRESASQSTLSFTKLSKKGKEPMVQTKLPFDGKKSQKSLTQSMLPFKRTPQCHETQLQRLRIIAMEKLKKCIRLNSDVVALFRRANLVYFRHTQHSPELLTPAILARAKKWSYADYPYQRTADIWVTRDDLLAYEEALALEAEVDAFLDGPTYANGSGARERSTASRTPAPTAGRWMTPVTPAKGRKAVNSPVATRSTQKGLAGTEEEESVRTKNAREVKAILKQVLPRWKDLVVEKGENDPRRRGLERFDCGHILTRIVCKGAYALGILKEYRDELEVLELLLEQRRWRRARRGRWYERSALVYMTHLKDEDDCLKQAMEVVVSALKDPDTHIVFRPMLERRLTRLEKRLNIPPENRHICEGSLQKAEDVYVEGVRIRHREDSLLLDRAGRVVNGSPKKTQITEVLNWKNRKEPAPKVKQEGAKSDKSAGGKSIWKGRDGEEVSVEQLALEHYEDKHGCKGFHSEGRIVTTLFGLLFWEIIFAPIPGAFETKYQSAPLDLAEDTFYYSRQDLIEARLEEIEQGQAAEIVEREHIKNKDVLCIGVRWDLFSREDLVTIAKCLHPSALVAICRLMCEDYASRTSGVPDLIVWNEEGQWARFVEVKGPGDTLQENQKVWINVLLLAGMRVDVCHVFEQDEDQNSKRGAGRTPKKGGKTRVGQKRKRDESEDEEETDYSQLDRHTEDEEEAEMPATKRRRTQRPAPAHPPESPTRQKVARTRSQVEVCITSTPPSCNPSTSPGKRKRAAAEEI
ncbi:hypothetical protein L226DRAFT_479073 [Lentinus tigrinus ALCF2SS1-7]|uniref:Fanconi-associated nuclease n=1 Tax=Lentinus tigrinus ALCF2SS1-6 TaxID=1328759 RepID=A0A5C2STP9_9APHY|nr:hypothetical protein L227DRAFT_539590 [Lentinus tigrinus ALCF2SS1-6]RPD80362.1 hypothetical protein L226DRAFT_479073 [Lentinus tigrinus ALCF2SS1-7]